ncbi:MAG: hypothetical protein MI976_31725, partial [Pseudomonadales bacterium]|nr:hypothetical protein [Pseudomonadales bacterium]
TFFQSFNNRTARLISDVPKDWQRSAFQAINNLPHETCKPVHRKTLKESLKRLLRSNLVKNRGASSNGLGVPWIEFVAEENSKYPFAAILGLDAQTTPVQVFGFEELLFDSPKSWNKDDQDHVVRNAEAIVEAMSPLLIVSKSVQLVDPHFSFIRPTWERYEPVLRGLVKKLDQFNFGRGIKTVSIHTSDKLGSMSQQLENAAREWLPEGISVKVYHWPESKMHDRFVLTDVGGLYYGHGLDEASPGKAGEVLVSVLDHATYRQELGKVTGAPTRSYDVCGEVKNINNR